MVLPIGIDDTRVARWPLVTFTLAVLTVGISGSVAWHDHLTRNGTWFENVNAYWHDHPDLEPTDACAQYLTPPPADDPRLPHPAREPGDSRKLATLCIDAMAERAVNQPLWLERPDKGLLQVGTLTHGLAFPNIPAALVGLLLLVFVLGSFLEDRWGRDRFAAFWVFASVIAAVAYRKNALVGAEPLAGGNAISAACLGAFAVTFGKRHIQYLFVSLGGPRRFSAPAWSVAVFWLVAHIAVLALTDGRTPADSAAEFAGFGAGIAVGALARWQGWRENQPEAPTPVAAEPNWVKSVIAPPAALHDDHAPQLDVSRPTPTPHAPMFDDAPSAPLPTDDLPRYDDLPRFDDLPPLKPLSAALPEPVPLDADGGWARFAKDEPVLPARVPDAIAPLPAPSPAAGRAAIAPRPEPTVAFTQAAQAPVAPLPVDSFASLRTEIPHDPVTTPYWTLAGRDAHGLQLRDEDGVATRLDPRQLLAVAVGVVQTVDQGPPGPALIFDLILDVRPPRALRLRPTPDVLAAGWPGLTRQDAVVALARELAAGGAIRVPQVPEWPGPPWTTYPDTRTLMAAWQLALAKR